MFGFDLSQYKPVSEAPKEVIRAIVIWHYSHTDWVCQIGYKSKWDGKWRHAWDSSNIEPEYYCEIPGIKIW